MAEEKGDLHLHIDSDWKSEAAREKERLAEQEKAEPKSKPGAAAPGQVGFMELVNVLVMQAAVALGGVVGPGGERIPPNPGGAQYFIDLLDVLARKTQGNLTDEEKRALDGVLYELRLQYVQLVNPPPPARPPV